VAPPSPEITQLPAACPVKGAINVATMLPVTL
jgi:hypothetical protein